jgi:hypothetical protein
MGGGLVFGIVLLLLIVPVFAATAVVGATIVVLAVALAALVGLVALAAAALASPYLLVRSACRRLCPTKNTVDPLAERDPGADRPPARLRVSDRAHVPPSLTTNRTRRSRQVIGAGRADSRKR